MYRQCTLIAVALLGISAIAPAVFSKNVPPEDDPIRTELARLSKHGSTIERVRRETLGILESENACSAWFRETDPGVAGVFSSLHYRVVEYGPPYVYRIKDSQGGQIYKHPWAARTDQNGGRDSIVWLNPVGPFFNATSVVITADPRGLQSQVAGFHALAIGSFNGNSDEARITTLLHELAHVVGRIPEDSDSWDGHSQQNTEEVLKHCKRTIQSATQKNSKSRE